jgi:very-short-patch-repair endonuclease
MRTSQARRFRKDPTPAEKKLWARLRNRQLIGLKFRRQQPVGERIIDFLCADSKLAIELDGSGHLRHFNQASDLDKEIELYEMGIRVLRFNNHDVMTNLESVLNQIVHAIDPARSIWGEGV